MKKILPFFVFISLLAVCGLSYSFRPTDTVTKEDIWQSFRQQFPFHLQTIGQAQLQPNGNYLLLASEPPPHVSAASIKALFDGYNPIVEEKTRQLGIDGWTKDVLIELPKISGVKLDTLYRRLYRHLFFINPTGKPVDLNIKREPVYFSKDTLNYEVRNADLECWLLSDQALNFVPLSNRKAPQTALKDLMTQRQTGIWVSQKPILVAWLLPYHANLSGRQAEIRQFVENTDFIIGSVKINNHVAIIAHKRTVSDLVLPFMRTETILALASAPASGLGQSYERNFILADKGKTGADVAPIYLSNLLQHTDFGSLLNIADQMLKSWSLNGAIKYQNFKHQDPVYWPFKQRLDSLCGSKSITFNGNMSGATQAFSFAKYKTLKNVELSNVSRTGAMAITYEPEGISEDSVRMYEHQGWKYFANLNNPVWAQNLRYAALFQIFKDFDITAQNPENALESTPDTDVLEKATFRILKALDSISEQSMEQYASTTYLNPADHKKFTEVFKQAKSMLNTMKGNNASNNLKEWAHLIGNPWTLRAESSLRVKEAIDFMKVFERLKSFDIYNFLGIDVSNTLLAYSKKNVNMHGAWIKTPLLVASYDESMPQSTGGHNIGLRNEYAKTSKLSYVFAVEKTRNKVELQLANNSDQVRVVIDDASFRRLNAESKRKLKTVLDKLEKSYSIEVVEEEMRKILNEPSSKVDGGGGGSRPSGIAYCRPCEFVLPVAAW